jgi:hypothetical protein
MSELRGGKLATSKKKSKRKNRGGWGRSGKIAKKRCKK